MAVSRPPFVACKAGEKIGKYTVPRECSAPIQCMVISFFHELAHMIGKLPDKVGDSFCREIWAMAYGLEYAKEKYGLTFSDAAVAWKFREGLTCFDTRKVRV